MSAECLSLTDIRVDALVAEIDGPSGGMVAEVSGPNIDGNAFMMIERGYIPGRQIDIRSIMAEAFLPDDEETIHLDVSSSEHCPEAEEVLAFLEKVVAYLKDERGMTNVVMPLDEETEAIAVDLSFFPTEKEIEERVVSRVI